jgi:hypothetical protein
MMYYLLRWKDANLFFFSGPFDGVAEADIEARRQAQISREMSECDIQ